MGHTRFRKKAHTLSLIIYGLITPGKEALKTRCQYCKNSNNVFFYIRAIQGYIGGEVIAPEVMGSCRYSTQMEGLPVSQGMLF